MSGPDRCCAEATGAHAGQKRPSAGVFGTADSAGTIATDSSLRAEITAVGDDTALAVIQRLVAEAPQPELRELGQERVAVQVTPLAVRDVVGDLRLQRVDRQLAGRIRGRDAHVLPIVVPVPGGGDEPAGAGPLHRDLPIGAERLHRPGHDWPSSHATIALSG